MKKIKLNWGHGLALGMGVFLTFIVTLGVFMFKQSSDEYDDKYYEKGLAYDTVYNKERQVVIDKLEPKLQVESNNLHIVFLAPAKGSVHFERWADPGLDKDIPFTTGDTYNVDIPLSRFKSGRWDLSFDWANNGKKYLFQKQIRLP